MRLGRWSGLPYFFTDALSLSSQGPAGDFDVIQAEFDAIQAGRTTDALIKESYYRGVTEESYYGGHSSTADDALSLSSQGPAGERRHSTNYGAGHGPRGISCPRSGPRSSWTSLRASSSTRSGTTRPRRREKDECWVQSGYTDDSTR